MKDLEPLAGLPAGIQEDDLLAFLEDWGDGRPLMKPETYAALRAQIGSQADVAGDMNINRRTLGRYERGERDISLIPVLQIRRAYRNAQRRKAQTVEALAEIGESANA